MYFRNQVQAMENEFLDKLNGINFIEKIIIFAKVEISLNEDQRNEKQNFKIFKILQSNTEIDVNNFRRVFDCVRAQPN